MSSIEEPPPLIDSKPVTGLRSILKKDSDNKLRHRKTVSFSRVLRKVAPMPRILTKPCPAVTVNQLPLRTKYNEHYSTTPAWKENVKIDKNALPPIKPEQTKQAPTTKSTSSVTRQPSINKETSRNQQYMFPELPVSKKPLHAITPAERTTKLLEKQRIWKP